MTTILLQHIHANTPGVPMLEMTKERHQRYCDRYGITYRATYENAAPEIPVEHGNWSRVKLIQNAMNEDFDVVIWLDADTLICDMDENITDAAQANKIGVCWHRIPQLHHWNIGALYIHNTDETKRFIDNWMNGYKDNDRQWLEQGVFNKLARQSKTVVTLSDKWNATLDVSMVPDAVVLGFHGQGDTAYRINEMKSTLDVLAKRESALASPADGERRT
jgi:hypothetical protein